MSMMTKRKSGVYHLLATHALRTQRSQSEVLGIRVIVTLFLKIRFEYLPPGLTLRTLYSVHIMNWCSFREKKSDFSLYGIHQLVFLMKCVLCAVRSESLYIMYMNLVS